MILTFTSIICIIIPHYLHRHFFSFSCCESYQYNHKHIIDRVEASYCTFVKEVSIFGFGRRKSLLFSSRKQPPLAILGAKKGILDAQIQIRRPFFASNIPQICCDVDITFGGGGQKWDCGALIQLPQVNFGGPNI